MIKRYLQRCALASTTLGLCLAGEQRGKMTAAFHCALEQSAELRDQADREGKIGSLFNVDVIDEQGEVVAKVEKRLYIRKKSR